MWYTFHRAWHIVSAKETSVVTISTAQAARSARFLVVPDAILVSLSESHGDLTGSQACSSDVPSLVTRLTALFLLTPGLNDPVCFHQAKLGCLTYAQIWNKKKYH